MTPPTPALEPTDGYGFYKWIAHRKQAWLAIALAAGIYIPKKNSIGFLIAIIPKAASAVAWIMRHGGIDSATQAVIVLLLLVLAAHPTTKMRSLPKLASGDRFDVATAATRRFYFWWLGLLVSWVGFYVVAWLQGADRSRLSDRVNSLEFVFLLAAYLEMAGITLSREGKTLISTKWTLGAIFGFYTALAVAESIWPNDYWWSVASGLVVGVSMALFVGRLESRFIAAPLPITALLFVYAVLQVTYPLFNQPKAPHGASIQIVMTICSLPLKVIMFLAMDWLYAGGKLFFYMVRERELLEKEGVKNVEDDWKAFWGPATSSAQILATARAS